MAADSPQNLLDYFAKRQTELVASLGELVRIDAPTGDAPRVQRFVTHYRELLADAGLRLREIEGPRGPHLFGERDGDDPPIVLLGHSDTVWPAGEAERRPPEVRDGSLHGPGVFDMRGGLCLIAWALTYLNTHDLFGRRRILLFVSADEEDGSRTARGEMTRLLPSDAIALVPEPPCPDGSVKIARKGVGIFHASVTGREAHAGVNPEQGVSAIAEIARLVVEVESWRDPDRGRLVSVGTIEGGSATNVVPATARCGIDVRFDRQVDGDALEAKLRALRPRHPDATLRIDGGLEFPPMVPTERSHRLSQIAIDLAAREFGWTISAGSSGGGSDGSHLAARGLTVLDGLGPEGGGAHAMHEHVVVDRLPRRAAFFTRLLVTLGNPEVF